MPKRISQDPNRVGMSKKLQYKRQVMPQYAAEMFLLDMEDVDSSMRSMIADYDTGSLSLPVAISRIKALIRIFDRYQS